MCKRTLCGKTQIFWLGFCNFVGGVLFLLAATSILVGIDDPALAHSFEDVPYLIGSGTSDCCVDYMSDVNMNLFAIELLSLFQLSSWLGLCFRC